MERGIGGRTVAELEENMSSLEFFEWSVYYRMQAAEREAAGNVPRPDA